MAVAFTRVTSSRRGTSTCEAARLVFVVLPMRFPRARASLSTAPSGGNPNGWGVAEPAWWLNLQAAPQAVVELAGARSKNLDAYAARRPRETAVVVFEPRPERP